MENVEEMLRYFSLQLGVELNEKSTGAILHYLYSREISIFSPESLIEAAKQILMQKNPLDSLKICLRIFVIPMI